MLPIILNIAPPSLNLLSGSFGQSSCVNFG